MLSTRSGLNVNTEPPIESNHEQAAVANARPEFDRQVYRSMTSVSSGIAGISQFGNPNSTEGPVPNLLSGLANFFEVPILNPFGVSV